MYRAAMTMIATGLLASGAVQAQSIRVEGQLISTTTGEPPLVVSSGDVVSEFNADRLDGFDVGDFATAESGVGVHYKNLVGVPGREIDQDCAVGGGCFSGDTGGFPVTIAEPGSYRLAGNLDVTGENTPEDVTAIRIDVSNVTLDLKGFNIRGPVSCTGTPVSSCSPSGGMGNGVEVVPGAVAVAVRNGTVRGMGRTGVRCGGTSFARCLFEDLRVTENGAEGLLVITNDGSGLVRNVTAYRNGGRGIDVQNSVLVDCQATENETTGISASESSLRNCVAKENGFRGISAGGSRVSGSVAHLNAFEGIFCGDCLLVDSVVSFNQGDGVEFTGDSAWKGNLLFNNVGSAITGSAVSLGDNACDGTLC